VQTAPYPALLTIRAPFVSLQLEDRRLAITQKQGFSQAERAGLDPIRASGDPRHLSQVAEVEELTPAASGDLPCLMEEVALWPLPMRR
jgi:hypothetical protein